MINDQIVSYVRTQIAAGFGDAEIKNALMATGWAEPDINEAFASIRGAAAPAPAAPAQPEMPPVQTMPTQQGITAMKPTATRAAFPNPQAVIPKSKERSFSPTRFVSRTVVVSLIFVVLVLCVAGGVAYAYIQKQGPFAQAAPYTQDNLLSGLLETGSKIDTSSYALSGSLSVGPRDAGALPFTIKISNEAQLRQQYQDDSTRMQNVSAILQQLRGRKGGFPTTLQALANEVQTKYKSTAYKLQINDPVSGAPYEYNVMLGGKDFSLSVAFETPAAISQIRRFSSFSGASLNAYSATSTPIEGQKVTFTKDSSTFMYMSSEPPKPLLVQLGDYMRVLPGDAQMTLSVAASSNWSQQNADWKFNSDATANFGDLSFKIDADALKKDSDIYFRVNNIPSILGESLASIKGQWVKIDPQAASSTLARYNEYVSIASQLPDAAKKYQENRAETAAFIRKVVGFADQEHLLTFKSAPVREVVEGRTLFRYDVSINKEAIVPFYKKLVDEANATKSTAYSSLFNDPGTINYLQSDEFAQVFDYLDKNTTITLWVDAQGFPAIAKYGMRVVPPDTAIALKDKQVNITLKLVLSGINEPVDITAPTDAKPIQDLIQQETANLNYSSDPVEMLQNNMRVANTAVRMQMYKLTDEQTAALKPFPVGKCKSLVGTVFTDDVVKSIATAAGGDAGKATCVAKGKDYAISVPLETEGYSWCVDSAGASKQIRKTVSTTSCN